MSQHPAWYNIRINKGSTFLQPFQLTQMVMCKISPVFGETILQVEKTSHLIPVDTILDFGNCVLKVREETPTNSYSVPITVLQGNIANIKPGQVAATLPIDLTGITGEAKVKKKYTDSSPLLTFTVELVDAVNGQLSLSLSSVDTSALTDADCNIDAAKLVGKNIQDNSIYCKETLKELYRWDLELTTSGSVKTRYIEGYALVTNEATE